MSLSLGVEENDQDHEDDDEGWEEEEGHIAGGFFTSWATREDPGMDCSVPGFPVLHYLPEFVQIQVHWVSDAM